MSGKKARKKAGKKEELKIIWEPSSKRRQARPSALPSSHFLPIFHSVFPFAVGKFNQRQAFNAIEVTRQCNLSQFAACNMPHLVAAGNLLPYLSARFVAFAFAVSYCWCLSHCLSVCLSAFLPAWATVKCNYGWRRHSLRLQLHFDPTHWPLFPPL